jgi:hypothetical protein
MLPGWPPLCIGGSFLSQDWFGYTTEFEADLREPTSGLDPLTCSLQVIFHALQGFARVCKSPISKPVSFLCLALCCTVLRSQWCQSGVNRDIAALRSCLRGARTRSTSSTSLGMQACSLPWTATLAGCPLWVATRPIAWTKRWARQPTLALCFPSVVPRVAATARRGLAA